MITYTPAISTPNLAIDYNPFTPSHTENPYPDYARVRKEVPIFYSPTLNLWIVTRYDDVSYILKTPSQFSSVHNFDPSHPLPSEVTDIISEHYPNIFNLVVDDPPAHERLRGLMTQAFMLEKDLRPRQQARNREIIQELINSFIGDGQADLIGQYTALFPVLMISEMTGLPHEDVATVVQTCDEIAKLLWGENSLDTQLAYARNIAALQQYLTDQLEERRKAPRQDILSDMIQARLHGEATCYLTIPEIVNMLTTMLFAMYENIPKGIGNALMLLLKHPDQLQALRENPDLIENAIEEAVRMEPSIKGLIRSAKQDIEIGGVIIPAGARLQVMLASANHDEAHFADPDRFDIYRENLQKHLAFGSGIHRCIGIPLTRALGRMAIEGLLERLPDLRLQANQTLEFEPNLIFRILKRLPVEWDVPAVSV